MKQCDRHQWRRWLMVLSLLMLSGSIACVAQPTATSPRAVAYAASHPTPGTGRTLSAQGDPVMVKDSLRDALEPNRPNPFGTTSRNTTIGYSIAEQSHVEIRVYDFFYRPVITLVDEVKPAGRYEVTFKPEPSLITGMYFYEMKTERGRELLRMLYVQ